MKIDKDLLEDKKEKDIIRSYIDQVTKTEEGIKEQKTSTTDLKIFVANKKEGYSLGNIRKYLGELREHESSTKYIRDFINNHTFEEDLLNENISLVTISTPNYEREDKFVFIDKGEYIWILTNERKKWVRKTVEKLLKYLPNLERLYLSSDDLQEIIEEIRKGGVSGFTSKYHSPYSEKQATLQFHGADRDDLKKARDEFKATPTRIEFDQKNSPESAIQGANNTTGYITIQNVKEGSEKQAVETLTKVLSKSQQHDSKNYKIDQKPLHIPLKNGFTIDGFSCIELKHEVGSKKESKQKEVSLSAKLEDEILSKNQYKYGKWGQNTFFVFDKKHQEVFEVGVEEPNIVIHTRETTSELSIRGFCKNVMEDFDSNYSIEKKQANIS